MNEAIYKEYRSRLQILGYEIKSNSSIPFTVQNSGSFGKANERMKGKWCWDAGCQLHLCIRSQKSGIITSTACYWLRWLLKSAQVQAAGNVIPSGLSHNLLMKLVFLLPALPLFNPFSILKPKQLKTKLTKKPTSLFKYS